MRIQRIDDAWRVTRLASVGGPRIDRPAELDDVAASVADHPRITMPDSARWDIYAGHTTDADHQNNRNGT